MKRFKNKQRDQAFNINDIPRGVNKDSVGGEGNF